MCSSDLKLSKSSRILAVHLKAMKRQGMRDSAEFRRFVSESIRIKNQLSLSRRSPDRDSFGMNASQIGMGKVPKVVVVRRIENAIAPIEKRLIKEHGEGYPARQGAWEKLGLPTGEWGRPSMEKAIQELQRTGVTEDEYRRYKQELQTNQGDKDKAGRQAFGLRLNPNERFPGLDVETTEKMEVQVRTSDEKSKKNAKARQEEERRRFEESQRKEKEAKQRIRDEWDQRLSPSKKGKVDLIYLDGEDSPRRMTRFGSSAILKGQDVNAVVDVGTGLIVGSFSTFRKAKQGIAALEKTGIQRIIEARGRESSKHPDRKSVV